jgi:hypothetical protein
MSNIREPKRQGAKHDWFKGNPLMAIKKVTRNRCLAKMATAYWPKEAAAAWAIRETHRQHPEFIPAWELQYNISWKGDNWFAGRINHQSEDQGNKKTHMRVEEIVKHATVDMDTVYTWEDWVKLIEGNVVDGLQLYYAYLLPFSYEEARQIFPIQKLGITTNLYNRYIEFNSRTQRGETGGVGLWAASNFILTCELGRLPKNGAEMIENECKAAIGNGHPPRYGNEWFEVSTLEALTRMSTVLEKRHLKYHINDRVCQIKVR